MISHVDDLSKEFCSYPKRGTMNRIEYLEDRLDVKIVNPVNLGMSLEKYFAIFKDEHVMLRIYSDGYYNDRFLREGLALRNIESIDNVETPKII